MTRPKQSGRAILADAVAAHGCQQFTAMPALFVRRCCATILASACGSCRPIGGSVAQSAPTLITATPTGAVVSTSRRHRCRRPRRRACHRDRGDSCAPNGASGREHSDPHADTVAVPDPRSELRCVTNAEGASEDRRLHCAFEHKQPQLPGLHRVRFAARRGGHAHGERREHLPSHRFDGRVSGRDVVLPVVGERAAQDHRVRRQRRRRLADIPSRLLSLRHTGD